MVTFKWSENSEAFYNDVELENYHIAQASDSRLVLQLNPPVPGLLFGMPYRIEFTIAGGDVFNDGEGGGYYYTQGTITGIRYLTPSGRVLMQVSGLDVPAPEAMIYFNSTLDGRSDFFWMRLLQQMPDGAVFTGSNETGEAGLDWAEFLDPFDLGDDMGTTTGNDTVNARGGNDYISDYGGADRYDGGDGALDLLSYHGWRRLPMQPATGISADLAAGRITGPDGQVDQVTGIEALRGTMFADELRGDGKANVLIGGAGADVLDGRAGFDIAWYNYDGPGGIVADMGARTVRDMFGTTDRLISIEGIVGGRGADAMFDAGGAQSYDGREGEDRFFLAGGNDTVTGGADADVFKFTGRSFGRDVITDFKGFEGDRVHITALTGFGQIRMQQVGDDVVISVGTGRIVLENTDRADLTADHFLFG